jgi:hypothetical protein
MPILSGSAPRAKQASMAITPTKTILGQIIRFRMINSRFGIGDWKTPNCFIV